MLRVSKHLLVEDACQNTVAANKFERKRVESVNAEPSSRDAQIEIADKVASAILLVIRKAVDHNQIKATKRITKVAFLSICVNVAKV